MGSAAVLDTATGLKKVRCSPMMSASLMHWVDMTLILPAHDYPNDDT